MMNEVRYADLLDKLGEMSQSQLAGLLTATEDRMAERLERFQYLCKQLEMYLDTIFKEFPNANVYLVKSPEETVNLLDLIIPQDFLKKWEGAYYSDENIAIVKMELAYLFRPHIIPADQTGKLVRDRSYSGYTTPLNQRNFGALLPMEYNLGRFGI